MNCPACNAPPTDDARVCSECGYSLSEAQPAPSDPLLGTIIKDQFRVIRLVGEGATSKVYEGEQQMGNTTRPVALKVLRPSLSNDPYFRARFDRECQTVVGLYHPNTIQFLSFGEIPNGLLFIAMELLRGTSVAQVLQAQGAIPPQRVENILREVCGSLREAHNQGIVHRDLKPANVFLVEQQAMDASESVKLLGFWLAARAEATDPTNPGRLTPPGTLLGTPPYMSPEQFVSTKLDPRSDVYSLGIMAYEMLMGVLPFHTTKPGDWARLHLTGHPTPFERIDVSHGSAVPESMKQAVMRALSKSPDARHANVEDFIHEFSSKSAPASHISITPAPPSSVAPRAAPPTPSPFGTPKLSNPTPALPSVDSFVPEDDALLAWEEVGGTLRITAQPVSTVNAPVPIASIPSTERMPSIPAGKPADNSVPSIPCDESANSESSLLFKGVLTPQPPPSLSIPPSAIPPCPTTKPSRAPKTILAVVAILASVAVVAFFVVFIADYGNTGSKPTNDDNTLSNLLSPAASTVATVALPPEADAPAEVALDGAALDAGPSDAAPTGAARKAEIYAHTKTKLFRFDPISRDLTEVGQFDCVADFGMASIAIDQDRRIVGSTPGAIVDIDKDSAHCTVIAKTSGFFTSLSFVPAGTVDPEREVLVSYKGNDYLSIDLSTGKATPIGSLNAPNSTTRWVLTGDVVSVIGGGTYATVHSARYGSKAKDTLVEVDPKRGHIIKVIGNTGFQSVLGLAYWGGVVYAVSNQGTAILYEINVATGITSRIMLSNPPADTTFWGAGVTTSAPVSVPR